MEKPRSGMGGSSSFTLLISTVVTESLNRYREDTPNLNNERAHNRRL